MATPAGSGTPSLCGSGCGKPLEAFGEGPLTRLIYFGDRETNLTLRFHCNLGN